MRLSARSYAQLDAELHGKLKAAYPALKFATVQSYRSKSDFGDLDMLVGDLAFDARQAALSLGAVEVVSNGPVTSSGLLVDPQVLERTGNLFQVDFIKVAAEEFDYAQKYLAFNDLGNLVGRIAHKMGLAHRHDGLYFFVRDGDYLYREILLTRDYDKALTVMGFSSSRFALGLMNPPTCSNTPLQRRFLASTSSCWTIATQSLESEIASARPTWTFSIGAKSRRRSASSSSRRKRRNGCRACTSIFLHSAANSSRH